MLSHENNPEYLNIRVPRRVKVSLDTCVDITITSATDKFTFTQRGRIVGIQLPDDSPFSRDVTIRIEPKREPGPDW